MTMEKQTALILFVLLLTGNSYGSAPVPFTHDFNSDLHGWTFGNGNWDWTAGNSVHPPNTTNIPSFYSDGNYIWTQKSMTASATVQLVARVLSRTSSLVLREAPNFTLNTGSTHPAINAETCSSSVYTLERDSKKFDVSKLKMTRLNTDNWQDMTIDCQKDKCCDNDNCDLRIAISGSTGCSQGAGLIAIRCVSTDDNGCGPIANTTRMTSSTTEASVSIPHETSTTNGMKRSTLHETSTTNGVLPSTLHVTTKPSKPSANNSWTSGSKIVSWPVGLLLIAITAVAIYSSSI